MTSSTASKLVFIFLAAFITNAVWETFHSNLYVHYQGGAITQLILLRAAIFDAGFITLLAYPFTVFPPLHRHGWFMVFFAFSFAIGLELFALETGRWAYREAMPLIPLLGVGLTPVIQLPLLTYISNKAGTFISSRMIDTTYV